MQDHVLLDKVLRHLEALVAFDTRNPPREIGTAGIFAYLRAHLPGFRCTITDHGEGAVSLLAIRGEPKRVFNVHLDTVPSSPAWTADPLKSDLEAFLASSQRMVNGEVVLETRGGRVDAVAVRSPHLLHAKGATYAQSADWGVEEAEGFIRLFGMSSTLWAQVNGGQGD